MERSDVGYCKEKLVQEVLEHRFEQPKHVLTICSEILDLPISDNDSSLLGFAYFYRGEAYYILSETEEMFQDIDKSILYLEQSAQWELLARAYNLLAITSINRGNAPVAVDYYLKGLHCCKEHQLDTVHCSITLNLGVLYMQNEMYEDAESYFQEAYEVFQSYDVVTREKKIGSLIMIYTNLATCCMLCGELEKARSYIDGMEAQCSVHFCDMDQVYVGCMKTRYYHLCGEFQKRDAMIEAILQRLDATFPLMDVFDELYYICELSLEIGRYDVFWKLADGLDSVVVENKMFDLERRLLELKITYYRANGSQKQYNIALQRFFELHTILETESKSMVSSMLRIRSNMEHLRERKEQMEELNAVLTERVGTDPLTGKVASVLKHMQNDNVFCARYGGDEFIIIYNGIDSAQVYEMANELREQIIGLQITHEYSKADSVITISQGICQNIPKAENKSWDFLTVADNYLYQVKRKERNNICVGNLHGKFWFYQQA